MLDVILKTWCYQHFMFHFQSINHPGLIFCYNSLRFKIKMAYNSLVPTKWNQIKPLSSMCSGITFIKWVEVGILLFDWVFFLSTNHNILDFIR